jgi:hypothetical protein
MNIKDVGMRHLAEFSRIQSSALDTMAIAPFDRIAEMRS